MDDEGVTFGVVNSRGEYKAKSNFSIKLETFVEAGANTGYFVTLKRKSDGLERYVLIQYRLSRCVEAFLIVIRLLVGFFFFFLVSNQALLLHG